MTGKDSLKVERRVTEERRHGGKCVGQTKGVSSSIL